LAISSIQDHFYKPDYAMYKNLECLLLKAANQADYSAELQEVVSFNGDDINEVILLHNFKSFSKIC